MKAQQQPVTEKTIAEEIQETEELLVEVGEVSSGTKGGPFGLSGDGGQGYQRF